MKLANDAYEDERVMWRAEITVLHERLEQEYDKERELLAEIEGLQERLKEWEVKWGEAAKDQNGDGIEGDEDEESGEEDEDIGEAQGEDTEMTFRDADGAEWEIVGF